MNKLITLLTILFIALNISAQLPVGVKVEYNFPRLMVGYNSNFYNGASIGLFTQIDLPETDDGYQRVYIQPELLLTRYTFKLNDNLPNYNYRLNYLGFEIPIYLFDEIKLNKDIHLLVGCGPYLGLNLETELIKNYNGLVFSGTNSDIIYRFNKPVERYNQRDNMEKVYFGFSMQYGIQIKQSLIFNIGYKTSNRFINDINFDNINLHRNMMESFYIGMNCKF